MLMPFNRLISPASNILHCTALHYLPKPRILETRIESKRTSAGFPGVETNKTGGELRTHGRLVLAQQAIFHALRALNQGNLERSMLCM